MVSLEDGRARLNERFKTREEYLGWMLTELSRSGQPCDVTFYSRKPSLDLVIPQNITAALMYGAGAKKMAEILSSIKFSDGTIASFNEIWTINPMPKGGFEEAELAAVDLAEGEEPSGPQGETLRQMISETYKCADRSEEDYFIRRFIAS